MGSTHSTKHTKQRGKNTSAANRKSLQTIQNVVLTVPHTCFDEPNDPGCDRYALFFAQIILKGLRHKFQRVEIVHQKMPRKVADANRKKFRHVVPMRDKLRKLLETLDPASTFVLDVHTFKDPYSWSGHTPFEIAILDNSEQAKAYSRDLMIRLDQWSFKTVLVHGGDNDIQNEARELGFKSVLLEIRQDMYSHQERLKRMVTEIARWIQRM